MEMTGMETSPRLELPSVRSKLAFNSPIGVAVIDKCLPWWSG
jgi:hypothetical protein